MEAKVIIVSAKKSNKSENTVWAVAITGHQPAAYCKSAYKAMRFAFLLKKRTGLNISDNCLARLSHEVAGQKAARAAEFKKKVAEIAESHSVDKVLAQQPEPQPEQKKKRGRPRKSQKVIAQQ